LYALDDFGYIDEDDNYIEYRVGAFSNVARLLIKKGMDINIKDNKGESALDKAISNKDEGLARVLVEAGAKK
ncbi:MAG: ankyrin repeat domain-containing protein, partial [Deltaproteobacteria bacterium]|nr:ankyrin repeat domain-containing protein [Deltaproteobacteria bacterium]